VRTTADPTAPPDAERAPAAAPDQQPAGIRDRRAITPPRSWRQLVRRLASIGALVTIDVCGLALGLYTALVLRWLYYEHELPLWGVPWGAEEEWLPFLTLITILVFWRAGLYAERDRRAGIGRVVSSLVLVAVITLVFAWGVDHEFGTYGLAPTAIVTSAIIIGLLRASYERITGELLRGLGVRRRAALVGEGKGLSHLHRTLGSGRGGIDYEFVGAVAPSRDGVALPLLGPLEELPAILAANRIDELIVDAASTGEENLFELVEQAHATGVQVRVAPTAAELLTQRAEYVPGQGVPLFALRPPAFAGVDWAVKRTFDLIVATLVVVVGLPLWLLIAAAIKLDSRGPVFYKDRRVGLGEREFAMFKFRTMRAGAADEQRQLEAANEASGALFKIRADPRVTRVGALLRRLSFDEVPQVLNVLRGEMSLVGPRPLPLRDYHRLEAWHRKRYLVLPGITGLWQISGRSELTFDDLVRLDFYYLENWSIWLDVTILLKTIPAVFARKGAY
jgi:exopolysaccharide biosynthesis polyprenyl glycosylphosphotransferase